MQSKKWMAVQRLLKNQSFLYCPICKEDLQIIDSQCICKNKHTFDVAKKGYVNFALKKGDSFYNASMFLSRKKMMYLGLFDELIHQTYLEVQKHNPSCKSLMDVGCGEGYYVSNLIKKFNTELSFVAGIDLSKDAITLATSESQEINWFVADLTNMPCKKNTLDVLLNIFTPANYSEFYRTLKKEALLIKVVPLKNHFVELRQAMLVKEYNHENTDLIEHVLSEKFTVISKTRSTSTIQVPKDLVSDLVKMSPLSRLTNNYNIDINQITVDALIYVCKKKILT